MFAHHQARHWTAGHHAGGRLDPCLRRLAARSASGSITPAAARWRSPTATASCAASSCGSRTPSTRRRAATSRSSATSGRSSGNKWDGGWIIDPDKDPDKKYDVEITPQGDQKLKVMGYAGMKFLSETMIWTRANPDLKKCGDGRRARARPGAGPGARSRPEGSAARRDPAPAPRPAPAPEEAKPAAKGDKSASSGKKKDCKFDIPYVNATITVPCD